MISYFELLKRIEKGDIPEKIKVHLTNTPRVYKADYDGSDFSHYFIYDGETDENYHHYLSECFLESSMFEKNIEILDKKKIEKFDCTFSLDFIDTNDKEKVIKAINEAINNIYDKIDRIIDKLEEHD